MKQSQLFSKFKKESSKDTKASSHQILVRADFIDQLASGIYSFLPLGYKVLKKIEKVIREKMEKIGGQEVFLPTLQPKEIWQKTGRWENMKPPLFKIKDRHKKEFALGPTHEEVITKLVNDRIQSYRDLPAYLFQIQNKFRNELRFTGGLLRTREFLMKDLYSFHQNEEDLAKYFKKVLGAYDKIFHRCGLKAIKSLASGGAFTKKGATTYEFQVPTEVGEDRVFFCKKCKFAISSETVNSGKAKLCPACKKKMQIINTIEVGHCFKLGDKYSKAFDLYFFDKRGERKSVVMGCYGIGLGRLMATIVEINHDKKGIIWPREIAPFLISLVPVENNPIIKKASQKLYQDLQKEGFEVLYDDREDKSPGEKFIDCDLIGAPYRIVLSEKTLKRNCVELKIRKKEKLRLVKIKTIKRLLKSI